VILLKSIYNDTARTGIMYTWAILPIQRALNYIGYECNVTGSWDYSTEQAMRRFNIDHCIGDSGEPTPEAIKELKRVAGSY
jgi:hypothetical protein